MQIGNKFHQEESKQNELKELTFTPEIIKYQKDQPKIKKQVLESSMKAVD